MKGEMQPVEAQLSRTNHIIPTVWSESVPQRSALYETVPQREPIRGLLPIHNSDSTFTMTNPSLSSAPQA
jgi:hypothetical protein